MIVRFLPLLTFSIASITEKGSNTHCGSIVPKFEKTKYKHFPDIENFPSKNYQVKYVSFKKKDAALIRCKTLGSKNLSLDIQAKQDHEESLGNKKTQGRFNCVNGKWKQSKTFRDAHDMC